MTKYENLQQRNHDDYPTSELLEKILEQHFVIYKTFLDELAGLELEQDWQYYKGTPKSWLARVQMDNSTWNG